MAEADFDRAVAGIGSLAEPVRRELYRYVCSRDEPVGREEAAAATGLPHHRVKFHLDRLAADGLLEVDYQRLGERTGPGAGRPAKRYRRSGAEVAVSLPARDYELAGRLLAAAVDAAARSGEPVLEVLHEVAAREGRGLATRVGAALTTEEIVARVMVVLAEAGFEPREVEQRITLGNCPFHVLAQEHTELVCGMNHAMLDSMAQHLEPPCLEACLEPAPGRCCVVLRARERHVDPGALR
ncbi:transcriptional regulator [Ornithinimicrobium sp. F0845]|uniref:helix-turn-helix transcriptional regulator n=1 Tax=Ornithinimicrobium sp. F0845 TaxID=2926412 RepID=UPI001FF4EDA5|nr:helix-turn-helix domain-containing protein [Ornithinimicrobium sp. F0845]MCK0111793.1 transcriptional regulator [Ornithinimicrobium sp. F0845]